MQSNQSTEINPETKPPIEALQPEQHSPIVSFGYSNQTADELRRRLEFEEAKSKDQLSTIAHLESSFSHQIENASRIYLALMNEYYAATEKSVRQEDELRFLRQTINGLREALDQQSQRPIFEKTQSYFAQLYNSLMASLSSQTEKDREVITRAIREYQQSILQPLSQTLKEIQSINDFQIISSAPRIDSRQVTQNQSNGSGFGSDLLSKRYAPDQFIIETTVDSNAVVSKLYRENLKLKIARLQFEQKLEEHKIELPKECIDILRQADRANSSNVSEKTADLMGILARPSLTQHMLHDNSTVDHPSQPLTHNDIAIPSSVDNFDDLFVKISAVHEKIKESILMTHDLQAQIENLTIENKILRSYNEESENYRKYLTEQLQSVSQKYSELMKSVISASNQDRPKASAYQESFGTLLKSCTSLFDKIRSTSPKGLAARPVSTETLFAVLNDENDRLNERVARQTLRIEQLISEKKQTQSEYDILFGEFVRKDITGISAKLSSQIVERQSVIEQLQARVDLQETQIAQLSEEIADHKSKIADLTQAGNGDSNIGEQPSLSRDERFARPDAEEEFEQRLFDSKASLRECRQYVAHLRKKVSNMEHESEVKNLFRDQIKRILEHQIAASSTN